MLLICFLIVVSTADAESQQITSSLEEIKNALSTVNLKLTRLENRKTTSESMYNRLEDKINRIEKELGQKHSESILLLKNTVLLLNQLKVNDEGLETRQKTMIAQFNQVMNNTDRCCQGNIPVTCVCPTSTSLPTTQAPTSPVTPTTQPPTTTTTQPSTSAPAQQDCKMVKDGVYQLSVENQKIQVYCSGGFVTFQRRYNGQLNFDRTFSEYEQGFGAVSSEHWLGLRYLHLMTKDRKCTFRARLAVDNTQYNRGQCGTAYASDCDGKIKEILAQDFRVSSAAEKYKVAVVLDRTDFLYPDVRNFIKEFNGKPFTTKDQDNDVYASNCAALHWIGVNGGFWYGNTCHPGYPNSALYTSDTVYCSTTVCARWFPYFMSSSLLQFSC